MDRLTPKIIHLRRVDGERSHLRNRPEDQERSSCPPESNPGEWRFQGIGVGVSSRIAQVELQKPDGAKLTRAFRSRWCAADEWPQQWTDFWQGDWKYIPPNKGPAVFANTGIESGNAPAPQLYNLAEDPGEKNDPASQHPERVQEMPALLERIRQQSAATK